MSDRVIVMPVRYAMTPEQEAEFREIFKPIRAKNNRYALRNLAILSLVIGLTIAAWPWLVGIVEAAWILARIYRYELAVTGSALMLLVFGLQAVRRNKRKAVSA